MATWRDVGIDNIRAAIEMYDHGGGGQFRSSTSRFYYAAFSILTDELIHRNANPDFRQGRDTPGHLQLPNLIETYFTHFSPEKVANLIRYVRDLYRDRIAADYSLLRVDKQSAKASYRAAEKIFEYMGVNHERR